MNPAFIDDMSWEMAEVYGAISDQILINLAHYFPYWQPGQPVPKSSFEYQANMLAQMGKVNRDTVRIIAKGLGWANDALVRMLEQAIMESVRKAQPELLRGVMQGILHPAGVPVVAPNQMRAFSLYYQQASNKLNLVNTVMLESTQQAYQQAVAGVVADIDLADSVNRLYTAVDTAAGETITGISSWNQALRHATDRMKETGITGFIDHAGRHWSAEAYVAMDIRTTVANTARAAVWETNQNFGNDLYQVSYHDGARPLCYPWQNKVVSSTDSVRTVTDLDGNEIHVYAQSETTYGQAAGLFGINCKHYPSPFIPGVSIIRGEPQNEEENAKTYAESQEQRRLERNIREQKRDLMMLKAQGAPDEAIKAQREKVRASSAEIQDFCDSTGRARHRDREGVYTERKFPDADKYDVSTFEQEQKEEINRFFSGGGSQQGYTFGQMTQSTTTGSNVFGETIRFSEKMDSDKWDASKATINTLASEFRTKLKEVRPGAHQAAGSVQVSGTIMQLSSAQVADAIHEFAHTISIERQTKFGLYSEGDFWEEIRRARTAYRKEATDPTKWISSYEHSDKSVDEFMAEAFALAYMRENGMQIPEKYGGDIKYSNMVMNIVRKYFGK